MGSWLSWESAAFASRRSRVRSPSSPPWRCRQGTPYPPPSKEGGLPLCRIPVTAWSLKHPKCFTLAWRCRQGTPYPPPSKEGGLPLCRIPVTAWSLKHPKCFTLAWRCRQGTPYPPPSKEGGLPLCRILVTAWSLRQRKCFAPPNRRTSPRTGPSVWCLLRQGGCQGALWPAFSLILGSLLDQTSSWRTALSYFCRVSGGRRRRVQRVSSWEKRALSRAGRESFSSRRQAWRKAKASRRFMGVRAGS